MKKLTSVPNLNVLSQKLANPLPNVALHFLIGIPFLGNFSEGLFWRNNLAEFFERNFFGGFFGGLFWRIIGRIFLGGILNSLFTLELTCLSRFCFFQDFGVMTEVEFLILRSAIASTSHLKTMFNILPSNNNSVLS